MTDPKKKPAKKTPAKKAPAKKVAAKPKAAPAKQGAQRGRPRKKIEDIPDKVFATADEFVDELVREADEAVDAVLDQVIIRANDVKKKSLRDRMLKWFKR